MDEMTDEDATEIMRILKECGKSVSDIENAKTALRIAATLWEEFKKDDILVLDIEMWADTEDEYIDGFVKSFPTGIMNLQIKYMERQKNG